MRLKDEFQIGAGFSSAFIEIYGMIDLMLEDDLLDEDMLEALDKNGIKHPDFDLFREGYNSQVDRGKLYERRIIGR